MASNYIYSGEVMDDYVSASAVTSGDAVAVGSMLGVALTSAAANAASTVKFCGVFTVPKVAGTAVTAGAQVLYKAATKSFTAASAAAVTGDVSGGAAVCWKAAAAADTTMQVKFTGVPGTVTP